MKVMSAPRSSASGARSEPSVAKVRGELHLLWWPAILMRSALPALSHEASERASLTSLGPRCLNASEVKNKEALSPLCIRRGGGSSLDSISILLALCYSVHICAGGEREGGTPGLPQI